MYHDFLHFLSFVRHFGSLRWGKLQTDGSEDAQDGGEVHRRELWEIVEKRLSSSPGLLDIFFFQDGDRCWVTEASNPDHISSMFFMRLNFDESSSFLIN